MPVRTRLLLALLALTAHSALLPAAHAAPPLAASARAAEHPARRLPPLPPLALRPGPVPDYAPLAAVWTHPQLDSIAPALAPALDRAIGRRHRVEDYAPSTADGLDLEDDWREASVDELDPDADLAAEDNTLVWMRDYQPIYVRRPDGTLTWLRYLHENPNRQAYLPIDDDPGPFASERVQKLGTPVAHLPLLHENGNLVVAGRYVFLTDLVLEDNTLAFESTHLDRSGFVPLTPEQVVATLARAFWREPGDIIVLPRMPGEETGHVDLFLMPISDKTVVVPQIRDEAIERGGPAVDATHAREVQRFLDDIAWRVARLDLAVVRLPMVPPLELPAVDGEETIDTVVYSPANGLLLRTEIDAQVLVPAVDLRATAPGLAPLQRRYEQEWIRTFARHGWWARRVDATRLGRFLGLFRCVSQVVPAR